MWATASQNDIARINAHTGVAPAEALQVMPSKTLDKTICKTDFNLGVGVCLGVDVCEAGIHACYARSWLIVRVVTVFRVCQVETKHWSTIRYEI